MGDLIEKQAAFLRIMHDCRPSQRLALIRHATNEQIDAISQVALNILMGVVEVPPTIIKRLRKRRRIIHDLASRGVGHRVKKELLYNYPSLAKSLIFAVLPYINGR